MLISAIRRKKDSRNLEDCNFILTYDDGSKSHYITYEEAKSHIDNGVEYVMSRYALNELMPKSDQITNSFRKDGF